MATPDTATLEHVLRIVAKHMMACADELTHARGDKTPAEKTALAQRVQRRAAQLAGRA